MPVYDDDILLSVIKHITDTPVTMKNIGTSGVTSGTIPSFYPTVSILPKYALDMEKETYPRIGVVRVGQTSEDAFMGGGLDLIWSIGIDVDSTVLDAHEDADSDATNIASYRLSTALRQLFGKSAGVQIPLYNFEYDSGSTYTEIGKMNLTEFELAEFGSGEFLAMMVASKITGL